MFIFFKLVKSMNIFFKGRNGENGGDSVVVDSLFYVPHIGFGGLRWSLFCYVCITLCPF